MAGQETRTIPGEGLIEEAFCDVTLTAIVWKDEGVDLHLEMPDAQLVGSTTARLACRWLSSMVITLDLAKNPGPPLTWEGSVKRNAAGAFCLALQFGSSGSISIDCDRLELQADTDR